MKRGLKWLSLAGLALLCTAGFYAWSGDGNAPAPKVLRSAVISQTSLEETVVATGVIRPVVGAEVNVGSRISGTVISLPVEVGDRVEVGQLLARLDDTALKAAADQVRAEVALTRPQVTLAKAVLERRKRLAADGLASEEDLDIARSDLAIAIARLDESLARQRAAEINISYAQITAPISGVVAAVSTREGETVAAGFSAPTFVTIVDLDRLEVLAYVDETDIGRVFVGQTASFEVDTYSGVSFTGVVTAIQPKAELRENVVNYVIRLKFDAPDDDMADVISVDLDGSYTLRPEMTAHVRLVIDERDDALTAPRNALKRRNGRQYLLVQRGDAWVEQDVRTGWRSDSAVEILSGVQVGERVALNVK
jgi:macrolide-specific efflux system membrane fusion protein